MREGFWAVADTGIFHLVRADSRWSLQRFDERSGAASRVTSLPGGKEAHPGFDVSRDGRTAVWTQVDTSSNDIMLLEPWVD